MTASFQEVRRNSDGSINFDFYRSRAIELRRQAMRTIIFKGGLMLPRMIPICAAIATMAILTASLFR